MEETFCEKTFEYLNEHVLQNCGFEGRSNFKHGMKRVSQFDINHSQLKLKEAFTYEMRNS